MEVVLSFEVTLASQDTSGVSRHERRLTRVFLSGMQPREQNRFKRLNKKSYAHLQGELDKKFSSIAQVYIFKELMHTYSIEKNSPVCFISDFNASLNNELTF
jgi:hypothetical protein